MTRTHQPLKRVLGTPTAWLIGIGVAVGSGIFRTPGDVASELGSQWIIVGAWILGGLTALMQALVSAELATRYPKVGGEYVYLREAYGDFVAFFFGWSYTVFILGSAAATIGLAFGDFAADLFSDAATPAELTTYGQRFAVGAVVAVTALNLFGLRTGAGAQNALTLVKIVALLAVVLIGFVWGSSSADAVQTAAAHAASAIAGPTTAAATQPTSPFFFHFIAAMLAVHWSYDGATDSVKMAEEIKDVRRALPRALIGSAVTITLLYVLVNVALLRMVPAEDMVGMTFVPGEAMRRIFGPAGRDAMLLVAMFVCLGALNSMLLAAIRVTFALARDGLAFGFMARMSKSQAPVPALLVVGCLAVVLVTQRNFQEMLGIYYFVGAILFGLSFASLIVFRLREREFPAHAFRCPAGPLLAALIIAMQLVLAYDVVYRNPRDALYLTLSLAILPVLYFVWKRKPGSRHPPGHCQHCGHNLTGRPEPRCPECGTPFTEMPEADGAAGSQ